MSVFSKEAWNKEYNKFEQKPNIIFYLFVLYSRFKEIWNTLKLRSKHMKVGHNAETDLTVQLTTSFHLG